MPLPAARRASAAARHRSRSWRGRFRRAARSSCTVVRMATGNGLPNTSPRFGPTAEWDTAAGQAILEAAGGGVTTLAGEPLRYGKPGFCNPDFIARGRGRLDPDGG